MGEVQPDLLGGRSVAGRRTPKARKNARIKIAPQGHADKPGTGPAGETCGGCSHMVDFHFRRTFHKCAARAGDVWKGGRATDIRPLDAACSKFCRKANALPMAATYVTIEQGNEILADLKWIEPPGYVAETLADGMIRALRNARALGLTVDELAASIAQPAAVVRPRLSELHGAGKVRKALERRPGAAGRSLAVWLIREEGDDNDGQQSLI